MKNTSCLVVKRAAVANSKVAYVSAQRAQRVRVFLISIYLHLCLYLYMSIHI